MHTDDTVQLLCRRHDHDEDNRCADDKGGREVHDCHRGSALSQRGRQVPVQVQFRNGPERCYPIERQNSQDQKVRLEDSVSLDVRERGEDRRSKISTWRTAPLLARRALCRNMAKGFFVCRIVLAFAVDL